MKKKLINTMLAAVFFTAMLSCSKNDEAFLSHNREAQTPEHVVQNLNEPTRALDPSQVIDELAEEYGWIYDFNNIKTASPTNAPSVSINVVQSTWNSSIYLTIVLNSSANIIGLYDIQFTGLNNADSSYDYYVSCPSSNDQLFSGWVAINVPGPMPNNLNVYPYITIPSDYPYPIFADVTNGMVQLESYSYPGTDTPLIYGWKLALYAASTFYVNFFE